VKEHEFVNSHQGGIIKHRCQEILDGLRDSLLGVQEVPSSNLGSPAKFLKGLQTPDLPEFDSCELRLVSSAQRAL
jgi:hypothetical protein